MRQGHQDDNGEQDRVLDAHESSLTIPFLRRNVSPTFTTQSEPLLSSRLKQPEPDFRVEHSNGSPQGPLRLVEAQAAVLLPPAEVRLLADPNFLQTRGVRRPRLNSTSAWRNLVTICSVL